MTTTAQLDRFTAAYREAVEITYTGDTEQPPTGTPWAAYGLSETERDCSAFLAALSPRSWAFITSTDARLTQAGHDFWLTRQGHGTGFWDREDTWPDYVIAEAAMLLEWKAPLGETHSTPEYFDTAN